MANAGVLPREIVFLQMPFRSRTTQFFLTLFILGGLVWLGGSVIRTVIGFDVFVPGTLSFKPEQTDVVRMNTVRLYALTGPWTSWGFATCFLGGIGLIVALRSSMRRFGWLLMSAILFVIIIPIEGYLIWKDYQLVLYFDRATSAPLASVSEIFTVFLTRFQHQLLNMASGFAFFAAITLVLCTTFRPLHRYES